MTQHTNFQSPCTALLSTQFDVAGCGRQAYAWPRSAPSESHISLGESHQRMEVRFGATKTHVALFGVDVIWRRASTEPHVAFVDDVVTVIIVGDHRPPSQIDVTNKCPRRPVRRLFDVEYLIACKHIAIGDQLHSMAPPATGVPRQRRHRHRIYHPFLRHCERMHRRRPALEAIDTINVPCTFTGNRKSSIRVV